MSIPSFLLADQISVSRFCFGCEPLGGADWGDDVDVVEIEEAIELALDRGVNFFDTADVYGLGLSEIRLSEILGARRHDLVIATKGGVSWKKQKNGRAITRIDCSPGYIRAAVEKSLVRLRLERIPVYYIHWPQQDRDIAEAVETLYELQQSGKIGVIGCSNFSEQQLQRALEFAPVRLLQIPVNVLIDEPSPGIVDISRKSGIGIVGYNVLASGLLTGKYDVNSVFPVTDRRSRLPQFSGEGLRASIKRVEELRIEAKRSGLSLAQYAIKQALDKPGVEAAIVGIKRSRQFMENITPFV